MGENAGIEAPVGESTAPETPPVEPQQQSGDTGGGDNPAWKPFLDVLPSSLHDTVKPVLKEWDQGINSRFQEIHQQYEPYKQLETAGANAETIQQAWQLLQALDTDPRAFYDEMGKYYQFVGTGGQESPEQGVVEPQGELALDFGSPELNQAWQAQAAQLKQQEELLTTIAQVMLGQQQSAEEAQADLELDQALTTAREKHGDFNEQYVLSLVSNGMELNDAIAHYKTTIEQELAQRQRPSAPQVIGGSGNGSLPANAIDVTKLNQKQTRTLVQDILAKAASQNQ